MRGDLVKATIPEGTTCWVLTDGKAGDMVQCLGVARHLGLRPELRTVQPRAPWSWIAPRGPVDPREGPGRSPGPLAPPYPDLAIASGRRAVPYLRALKRASKQRTFTVFLKDPCVGTGVADVIWVPEHDRLRGANVIVTLTSPNRLSQDEFAVARQSPDPRLAALPGPRIGLILGGPSGHYRFTPADQAHLIRVARSVLDGGRSLMVTPSRRTPSSLLQGLQALAETPAYLGRCYVWNGVGANPYVGILAMAEAFIVTADSANMLGEAAMTGAPIHVVEPSGGHPKMTRFIDRLVAHGAVCRWRGELEQFTYAPLDATPGIAEEILRRYNRLRPEAG